MPISTDSRAIQTENIVIAHIPVLLVFQGRRADAAAQGTILFYHGFSVAKEINRQEYDDLARAGFLVVAVDNVGHGARRYPDFDQHFYHGAGPFEAVFTAAVQATAAEVPIILDELLAHYGSTAERLAIIGISMGGFIVYQALIIEPRLPVAIAILGSPRSLSAHPASPHLFPERFYPRALLSLNAGRDRSVSPCHARELHQALIPSYQAEPDRQKFVEFPESEHCLRPQDWQELWANTLAWLQHWLR